MGERFEPSTVRAGPGPAWLLATLALASPAFAAPGAGARELVQELVAGIGTRHANCPGELLGEEKPAKIEAYPTTTLVSASFIEVFEALPALLAPLAARSDVDLAGGILSLTAESRVHDCRWASPSGRYARARCNLLFEVRPDARGAGLVPGLVKGLLAVLTSAPERFVPQPRPPPPPGAQAPPPEAADPASLRPLLLDFRIDDKRNVALNMQVREELDAAEALFKALAHGPEVVMRDLWLKSVERTTHMRKPIRSMQIEATAQSAGPGTSPATARLFEVLRALAAKAPEARLDTIKCEAPARADGVVVLPTNLVFSGPDAALETLKPSFLELDPSAQVQFSPGEGEDGLLEALFELAPEGRPPTPASAGPASGKPDARKIILSTVGAPYSAKGTNPKTGFSVLGLIRYAYAHQGIRDLPKTVDALRADPRVTRVEAKGYEPQLGDIVLFKVPVGEKQVLYPGLVLDPGRRIFVIASKKKGRVVRQKLDQEPFNDLFDSALRLTRPPAGVR